MLRWLAFLLCLAVFVTVLGWISVHTLELEQARQTATLEAQTQERVRLALWRMDSLVSALLIRENARPTWHYQAFYQPDDVFTADNRALPKGAAILPSPLLAGSPDWVRLHFEQLPDGSLRSPQAPEGEARERALSWYAIQPQFDEASVKLGQLSSLLKDHPLVGHDTPQDDVPQEVSAAPAPVQAKTTDVQALANAREQMGRNTIVQRQLAAEKIESYSLPLTKRSAGDPPLADVAAAPIAPIAPAPAASSATAKQPAAKASPPLASVASRYRSNPEPRPSPVEKPAFAGDLRPLWLDDELLLVRGATTEGKQTLQGVWLDWTGLRERLLETIQDLLPAAQLLPVPPKVASTDATALVTLPVKLVAGPVQADATGLTSVLKPALALAWACLIAAAGAIAFVLHRAMTLSERRAAFVSAVTHELRTPLTTFQLYSEMLADDMVTDPAQRRGYLQTLCDESTRLMHLVENVLSFSRIERGRVTARLQNIAVQTLLDRLLPRLRQRAAQANLELDVAWQDGLNLIEARVDALAVEQILFNLTDNACKYAAPNSDPKRLELSVGRQGQNLVFTLRDFGPGLPAGQKKKLFRPFSKSATEAAHSAPGVGLGLALSRRLARELGGDLRNTPVTGRGTAFSLWLRVAEESER
jgi:signal transduction histidine kinase